MGSHFNRGTTTEQGRNRPEYIIVHESDSPWGSPEEIDAWHRERGFKCIGYHYVICNGYPTHESFKTRSPAPGLDGKLLAGRDLDCDADIDEEIGAHCTGFNSRSLGVCLIGRQGRYSEAQIETLYDFLEGKCRQHGIPARRILGHCETPSGKVEGKRCPSLSMPGIRSLIRARLVMGFGGSPETVR